LVATDMPSALAAKAATATLPIVFASGADLVQQGLVASFTRPGGNATGVVLFTTELGPKRLSLLRDLLPRPGTLPLLLIRILRLPHVRFRKCRRRRSRLDNRCSLSASQAKSRSIRPSPAWQ